MNTNNQHLDLQQQLKALLPVQFQEVVRQFGMPGSYLSQNAPQATQALDLLRYAEQHQDGEARLREIIDCVQKNTEPSKRETIKAASELTPAEKPHIDPHWHLKIDRISQRDRVLAQTRLMMREQKPKSLAFVWYGQEGQGIEIFHKRLLVELREDLTNACVHQVRPRWPEHLANYHDAFSDVLTEAFDARGFEDIPARVRADTHGKSTLIYVRHEPVRSTQLINPESLRAG
ncbi:MAG: hypothetical protein GY862_24270 [Gammaproteobacteria bacterium]|nr:hypothetical protein [Gammaproteobacteria bacterium]